MVGEAAGDGVADVVEAGLSQLTVAAVVSFDSTELTSTRTDSLSRIFFRKRKSILKFQRWLLFHV